MVEESRQDFKLLLLLLGRFVAEEQRQQLQLLHYLGQQPQVQLSRQLLEGARWHLLEQTRRQVLQEEVLEVELAVVERL